MDRTQQLLQRVVEYLDSQNWHYNFKGKDNNAVEFNMSIKNKLKSCRVIVLVTDSDIQAFGVCPINASPDVYSNVVEFITRANYGLKVGNFEFDYRDGEVRYQTCLSCKEGIPSLKDVERIVDMSFLMFQRYGDGLVKNLMGFGNPEEDIKQIEG